MAQMKIQCQIIGQGQAVASINIVVITAVGIIVITISQSEGKIFVGDRAIQFPEIRAFEFGIRITLAHNTDISGPIFRNITTPAEQNIQL